MKRLLYAPLDLLMHMVALLPFWVLYGISDCLFLLVYYVVRYRRKVAMKHISDSFPELSSAEQRRIARRFYRNFTDYIVETIKLLHISDKTIRRRMTFDNVELMDSLMAEGRQVMALFSHSGNWEWAPSVTLWSRFTPGVDAEFGQVYRPLNNRWFDRYMLRLRSRFGSVSYPIRGVLRDLLKVRRSGLYSVTGFMSDQKPRYGDVKHVIDFLNHRTATLTGSEDLARKLGMAVIYWDMEKPRRGHYHITMRLVARDAAATPEFEITDTYFRMLETTIRRNPPIWLWTHKRWKYPTAFNPDGTPVVES